MPKRLLGVVHLGPLPSSVRGQPFDKVLLAAHKDADAYRLGGFDGLVVENYGDLPFCKGTRDDPVAPDVPAALAVVARELRESNFMKIVSLAEEVV